MAQRTVGTPMANPEDWLTGDFADMILDEIKKTFYGERNFLMILLFLATGRRVGELIQLKVKDVDWDRSMILWNIEKKHKMLKDIDGYFIPEDNPKMRRKYKTEKIYLKKWKAIDSRSLTYLKQYIDSEKLNPNEYVFYSPLYPEEKENKHIARNSVWKFVHKAAAKLDLNVHPHTFRHTFAVWVSQNMKSPADLKKLKDMLEHSDTKVTETYLQFNTKETKDLLEETFNKKDL